MYIYIYTNIWTYVNFDELKKRKKERKHCNDQFWAQMKRRRKPNCINVVQKGVKSFKCSLSHFGLKK